ncbi:hypothetical protein [Streptomyces lydicamycinicus]|uniref:hypothetical protein n=1 Tax=Streptomyces lydicamycinicus TaxID=1546107 RepID=UPI003C2E4B58
MNTTATPIDTARLLAAAQRALESLEDLIANTFDPGVEALGARYELAQTLGALGASELPLDELGFARDPKVIRSAALHSAASTIRYSCPDHSDEGDSAFIACQCLAADELRRMAANADEVTA